MNYKLDYRRVTEPYAALRRELTCMSKSDSNSSDLPQDQREFMQDDF